jgi:hypothetical protein
MPLRYRISVGGLTFASDHDRFRRNSELDRQQLPAMTIGHFNSANTIERCLLGHGCLHHTGTA